MKPRATLSSEPSSTSPETLRARCGKRQRSLPAPVRLALTPREAAASLGISRDSFDQYVKPELRVVRRGSLVLVPVVELERWLDRSAALTLDAQR